VAFDHLRDALSVIFGLSVTQVTSPGYPYRCDPIGGMSTDGIKSSKLIPQLPILSVLSADTIMEYPSEDLTMEAARVAGAGHRSPEYVPDPMELEDHVPVYIPEPEHPEDLVPAEDEAPIEAYITEELIIPEAECRLRRAILILPYLGCEVGESSAAAAARQPGPTMARRVDCSSVDTVETRVRDTERRMMAALEVVNLRVLRRERLAYEQESIQTRQDLARSKAYSRALEARITVFRGLRASPQWLRVVAAMAEAEASRVRNGYDSNGSKDQRRNK
ncbi:hypothetical protein Tco_0493685, partial [Tanacetum coccineum]